MNDATILIVEDDRDISRATRAALELTRYGVVEADTLAKAREAVRRFSPDLILLDVLLPDGNGVRFCEELRGGSDIRILFISALGDKEDLMAGLRAGGDDYISKPYEMDELILRVKALLRRGRLIGKEDAPERLGGLTLDHTARRALLDGRDLLLKPKEFALLAVLSHRHGNAVPAQDLYEKVWGMSAAGDVRAVKEHISRIRAKLGEESSIAILSERGKGYRLKINMPRPGWKL